MKKLVLFVLVFGFGILGLMLGGCGQTSTSILYDSPNWMPDGRIICNKLVMTSTQQLYGTGVSESHSYITALTINNSNEVIKEENLFEGEGGNQTTCSPTGEFIAYLTVSTGITVSDYKGNKSLVPNTENPSYIDWSPDATKLVYTDYINHKLYVINKDGTNKQLLTSEANGPISWRIGSTIFYSNLYAIDSSGNNNKYVFYGRNPQAASTEEIICQGTDGIYKVIASNGASTKLFSNYDRYTLKLSFDGQKIVGGALGDPGIWIINIDGTGDKRLR